MLMLPRPSFTAEETFNACISRLRDKQFKMRLQSAKAAVLDASEQFDAASTRHSTHEIQREKLVGGIITAEEMSALYTSRMARIGAPGRYVYDAIFNSSPSGRCPLCAHRAVTAIDHHLPKAHYPALAVTPLNLVPSCTDCNKAKSVEYPKGADEVFLHPYYDNIDEYRWLTAVVIESNPAALLFQVTAPASWDVTLRERVERHFEMLDLAPLYGSEAAEELLNIRNQLEGIYAVGNMSAVRSELEDRANSCEIGRRNGWRAAAYRAWATNDWFCSGGFALNLPPTLGHRV